MIQHLPAAFMRLHDPGRYKEEGMSKITRLLVIVVLLMAAFPVTAFSASAGEQSITIGLALPNLNSSFFEGLVAGAQEAADQHAVELVVVAADDDLDTELANMQSLVERKVDTIIFRPLDPTLSVPAFEVAHEADVPVILVGDLDVEADEVASTITGNNLEGGQMAAEALCDSVGKTGTVLELVPAPDSAKADRNAGFEAYMAESCPDVSLVPFETADMDVETLKEALIDTFAEQKLDGVFGYDDATTQAALEASIIARTHGISFVGFDPSETSITAVKQFQVKALITPSPWLLGETGVETSLSLLNGEEVLDNIEVALSVLDSGTMEDFRACSHPPCGRP
jgi:ribose transport system substrate-binding protein